ncbi:protein kinase domain-containing protein [Verrucomicrobium spinosum]|uniref:protein kinase domain-containing protein n=1 Tax=Verrucomicrobium spinosum TaxID=2736 RepID=UPI0009461452|nr:protein kinase [Verrucomicrobium spinosum]
MAPTPAKQEEPIIHLRTSEKSRAAQKEIAKSFNGIDSGSVLSSAGMRMVLGEPTKYANLKDGVVHLMHKISDKLAPDSVGSHYKEALRLADEYQAIKNGGGSLTEQLAAVKNLQAQLEAHSPGGAKGESVAQLVKFADLEIEALEAGIKQEGQDAQAKLDHDSHRVDVIVGELVEDRALSGGSLRGEIQSFDRSSLKHVTPPKDQDVPGWAKMEFRYNSAKSDIIDASPQGTVMQEPLMLQEPGISSLSPTFKTSPEFIGMGAKVEAALVSGDSTAMKALTDDMAGQLMKDISSQGPLSERAFAISDGAKFKEELYKALVNSNPGGVQLAGSHRDASPEALAFLDGVYDAMLNQLSDRQTAPDKIVVGGKEYTKGAKLGEGGFGDVHVYEHQQEVTDPTTGEKSTVVDRIAVKSFKSGNLEEAAQEVRAHQSAMGPQGHENITAMKGVVRTPDGGVLIAMELAKTDGYAMMANLDKAVAEGRLTPVAANAVRLTILKDMLQGLQHFQETRGMTHLDVKEPNFFVGHNGRMLLGDFGFARTGDRQVLEQTIVDNPTWKAPEIIIQEEARSSVTSAAKAQKNATREFIQSQRDQVPVEERQAWYDQAIKDIDINTQLRLDMMGGTVVTNKADTWSIGISAYRLFHGESPFHQDFLSEEQRLIVEHGSDPENNIRELGTDQAGNSTGKAVTAMDRLFNQMLNPDPTKRPSITDLLRNPVFQEPSWVAMRLMPSFRSSPRKTLTPPS